MVSLTSMVIAVNLVSLVGVVTVVSLAVWSVLPAWSVWSFYPLWAAASADLRPTFASGLYFQTKPSTCDLIPITFSWQYEYYRCSRRLMKMSFAITYISFWRLKYYNTDDLPCAPTVTSYNHAALHNNNRSDKNQFPGNIM